MQDVAAVLMASGYSTRFRPLNRRHKSLIEIGGKSLLRRTIEGLYNLGVRKIVVVYREGQRDIVDACVKDIKVTLVEHKKELIRGSRSVLKVAYDEVKGYDKVLMLAPYHLGVSELLSSLLSNLKDSPVALVVAPKKGSQQYGNALIEGDRVVRVLEKKSVSFGHKISAIYAFRSEFVDLVVNEGEALYDRVGEAVLEFLLDDLARRRGIPYIVAELPSLKYPRHVLDRLQFLKERRMSYYSRVEGFERRNGSLISTEAEISHGAYIENSIVMPGAKIYEYAVIKGSFIGPGTIVGNHSVVRDSSIGESSIVGAHMEVARSVIENDVHTHSGFIGDSVIDYGCRIGAGTVTANVRLDRGEIVVRGCNRSINTKRTRLGVILGRDVRVGINVSFMPGTIVGSSSIIYPGSIVKGCYPEGSVVRRILS